MYMYASSEASFYVYYLLRYSSVEIGMGHPGMCSTVCMYISCLMPKSLVIRISVTTYHNLNAWVDPANHTDTLKPLADYYRTVEADTLGTA